mmetsp:Transcript_2007/g.4170  ORF Transcript_2007/g.4170 Transcript_2007/m.4170 type:complete len:93 (-) Transcript_2007:225-503(-)
MTTTTTMMKGAEATTKRSGRPIPALKEEPPRRRRRGRESKRPLFGGSGERAGFGCRSLGSGCKGNAAAVRTAKRMDRGRGSYRGGSGSGTAR